MAKSKRRKPAKPQQAEQLISVINPPEDITELSLKTTKQRPSIHKHYRVVAEYLDPNGQPAWAYVEEDQTPYRTAEGVETAVKYLKYIRGD